MQAKFLIKFTYERQDKKVINRFKSTDRLGKGISDIKPVLEKRINGCVQYGSNFQHCFTIGTFLKSMLPLSFVQQEPPLIRRGRLCEGDFQAGVRGLG